MRVPIADQVEQRRRVLAVLEGLEAVEDLLLREGPLGAVEVMEEQAEPPEPGRVGGDGLGRDVEGTGELAKGSAGDHAVEDRLEQVGALEPVADAEGLLAEMTPAVATAVTLDALRGEEPLVVAGALVAPTRWVAVE